MISRFLLLSLWPLLQLPASLAAATLSATPNPVLLGQPVTLSATVQPPEVGGAVTFYSGVAVLGVAPVSSGVATLTTTLLPAGANLISARVGASSLSSPLAVNVGVTPGTGLPGGIANISGLTPSWVTTADVNGDGIADLVTANAGDGTVSVFLGNGDGSFQPFLTSATDVNPVSVVWADFNGDGVADLAVVNSGGPSVSILLGNGDGTFQTTTLPFGSSPVSAQVADFNGDGNADIAVVDAIDNTVVTLLGSGNGNFSIGNPVALGLSPTQIAVADFNGDGKTDLAISGSSPDGVALLLGNGDGTFVLQPLLSAGVEPSSIVAADFNGDGKADLAVGDEGDFVSFNGGGIQILLGNGDGSFRPPIVAASGPNVSNIAVADFDGDGRLDLGVVDRNAFSTYGGNGDGTLQAPQFFAAGNSPAALAIGSFDGTGLTEVAVVNSADTELDVLQGSAGTCLYSLSPTSLLYDASSANGAAFLTANATGCSYAIGSDSWIVPQQSSGMGSASVNFQVRTNDTGFDRSGSVVIAGQTVAVSQRFTSQQFTDVPASGYNFDAVNLLKNKGITSGCGSNIFCPAEQVTRAQMAIFIVNAVYEGVPFTSSAQPYFTDVPPGSLGFKWIQKLFELGITSGCGVNLYCPNNVVTRAQMAVFLIRARFGATATFSSPVAPYFTDVPTGAFAFAWIQRMRFDGITSGCNVTLYCPGNSVVRGDMAIFIMRGLFNALSADGTPALVSVSPTVLVRGQPATFTFTGSNTGFVEGQTTVSTVPGVTASNVQVASPTSLSVDFSADSAAPVQPVGLVAITGTEQDVLPNGLSIQ